VTTLSHQMPALKPSGLNALGLVFNICRQSRTHGPGLRTTVYFKGCPLDCWWCHSPEGQSPYPEVMINEKRCVRCGVCVTNCPIDAITPEECAMTTNREICTVCGTCTENCEAGAREMIGRRLTAEELLAEIEADRPIYEQTGGGTTFSGGEPLIQRPFLQAVLVGCQERGIHTALDTTGFAPWEAVDSIRPYVDLFLYNVQLVDDRRHIQYTGVSNKLILENLRRLSDLGHPIVLRAPIIAGINDDGQSVSELCELVASLRLERVELLPYQPAPAGKYEALARPGRLPELRAPASETLAGLAECLSHSGLPVAILT